ncbi:hypothetical protein OSTOST_11348 [Ostertagia ostertagi]
MCLQHHRDFIYEVKKPQSDEITMELIKAVDMLMMDGLKAHCCAVLMRDITVENFAIRLQIADFLNDDRLFKRLVAFLATNRKDVFAHEDLSPEAMNNLPCRTGLNCETFTQRWCAGVMEAAWTYAESQFPYLKFVKRRRFCL